MTATTETTHSMFMPSAPPASPPLGIATTNSVTFLRPRTINHEPFKSMDDTLEEYKDMTTKAIGALMLGSVVGGVLALASVFAGFTMLAALPDASLDKPNRTTRLTLPAVTIGTMVALYETGTMKEIMNATIAKVEGLWNWDNMSDTTHQFLTFNVGLTLAIVAGVLAQLAVCGAVFVKDAHSLNKIRMQ